MISILHIDSDSDSVDNAQSIFSRNQFVSNFTFVSDTSHALYKLIATNPDIVFVEYPFASISGEDFVRLLQSKFPEVLIVYFSESKRYAVSAIRSGIYNFLLKPISEIDVNSIIEKVCSRKDTVSFNKLERIIEESIEVAKIRIQTLRGYLLLNPEEIIYCKADGMYTVLYLTNNRVETSVLFLSKVYDAINAYSFMKISRSIIINLRYLRKVYRDNCNIVLSFKGQEYEVKGTKKVVKSLGNYEID